METQQTQKQRGFCRLNCLKRATLLVIMLWLAGVASAQQPWEERKGCILLQGNIAPAWLFSEKRLTAYVDGDLKLFVDDRVAVTGALWFSVPTLASNKAGLRTNDQLYWGAEYHFLKPCHWDPYVAFTPGFALVNSVYSNDGTLTKSPYAFAPLISAAVGCNYYVGSVFHFFVRVQGVTGQQLGGIPNAHRIDELKLMAGLGFNLRTWKPKKHDTWAKK